MRVDSRERDADSSRLRFGLAWERRSIPRGSMPQPANQYGRRGPAHVRHRAISSRRGLIVARNVRLMTVAIRPGRPNGAASGFLSGMVREPLAGVRANVPVAAHTPVALASPANTLAGLMKAHTAHGAQRGPRTALNMPALSAQAQGCREREAEQDPVMQTLEARRR